MLIYDLIDPNELVGFVRALEFNDFVLDQYLPNRPSPDLEYRFYRNQAKDQDAAPYRSFDAEAAIGKRGGTARVSGELPPVSKKIRLGEEQRLRLEAQLTGDRGALIDAIFDDAANMTRAVQARLELARGQAIYTGTVVINENGMQATVDFGRAGGHTVAPATLWSNPAATIILNLRTWRQTYIDTNGVPPGQILTSSAVVTNMLLNTEIRTLAGSLAGTPNLVTETTLASVLTAFGLPPIVTNDEVIQLDGVATRAIPADRVVFMPPAGQPLGNTLFGITAEALELTEAGRIVRREAPGLVAVIDKTFDPVATWTKAAAIALPIVANPDLTLTADVQ